MAFYRKKPVIVVAWQVSAFMDTADELARWCGGAVRFTYSNGVPIPHIEIKTLEGTMRADMGDWIIKGVQGEFYPCKPDIFAATYERA